jgi:hypothetical protein
MKTFFKVEGDIEVAKKKRSINNKGSLTASLFYDGWPCAVKTAVWTPLIAGHPTLSASLTIANIQTNSSKYIASEFFRLRRSSIRELKTSLSKFV